MKKGELLFVYGTLRKGERADLARESKQFGVTYVGQDYINGEIYNLGSYPGLKTWENVGGHFDSSRPSVFGDVFRIRDESITALLDAYEGYPHLYNRIQTETAGGLHVWVYTYNHEVQSNQLIVSGDWQNRFPQEIIQTLNTRAA